MLGRARDIYRLLLEYVATAPRNHLLPEVVGRGAHVCSPLNLFRAIACSYTVLESTFGSKHYWLLY